MSGVNGSALRSGFIPELNGLRAIAIILVFIHHTQASIPALTPFLLYLKYYAGLGWMGVDLFFVLSGFLITGILIDTREASNYFTGFYVRRVLRIFPLYYLVLISFIVASQILSNSHVQSAPKIAALVPLPEDRWIYFCYLTNWIGLWKAQWDTRFASILAHFWSLGIEEQFYFVWPFVVWVVRPRAIPWIAGIVAGLSAIIRLAWVMHSGVQMVVPPLSIEIALATICRLDALFMGALCAYFFRDRNLLVRIHNWLPWVASLGIGLFFLAFSGMMFFPRRAGLLLYGSSPTVHHTLEDGTRLLSECGGFTLLALGFGALVLLSTHTETNSSWMQKLLKSRLLAPIGTYSYGIYVFHVPIIGLASALIFPAIRRSVHSSGEAFVTACAYIVVLAAVTFVISALSYEFFEKKILYFKRSFGPKYAPRSDEALLDDPAVAPADAVST
ncbi:MAG: acyltransferase [Terriglobales bacterium]|jgi:peptidoglycan/LPS O-acetylase OafA/YrhL